ncbi:hypothetical protein [Plebeiibacterium sediminum]|uniref:Uncharacterized protein n=1 Tax=Plebeiibacterium sediminum TaxID=2992112 RepID=A0AAE3M1K6_9BACT|nr:hypothetical protein [Plebeiobacterium sediminum]MCW3785459.1 hypothetical protein [Plebeiobacterium sediminum]
MQEELKAIGIVQKKEIGLKTNFEVLTVVHKKDYHQIKQINSIHISIFNTRINNIKAEIHKISKVNLHYAISFVIDEKYHQELKSGMECMVTFNYYNQYYSEVSEEILHERACRVIE